MAKLIKMGVEGDLGGRNFSTYAISGGLEKYGIHGYGSTAKEAIADTYVALKEMKELAKANGDEFPEVEFEFVFDVGSMFSYYSFLNITAVAGKLGINASLMRKYAAGISKPSRKRIEQIQNGIHNIAREMQTVSMLPAHK